jgi:hypothetical protein
MSKILIVSSEQDAHAKVVAWSLNCAGYEVEFWDTSFAIQKPGHSVHLSNGANTSIQVAGSDSYKGAWLRRVFQTKKFSGETCDADKDYVRGESARYVDNVLERMSDAGTPWLNDKRAAIRGEYKFEQLEACRKLGIRFPDTLISNDPAMVRAFAAKFDRIVVKPIDVYTWRSEDGSQLMTYANTITSAELGEMSDAQILACPAIYQQAINKVADVRAVIVGEAVFACRIESPHPDIDFRPFQADGTLSFTAISDLDMNRDLSMLINHFGLNMASTDFCIDAEGERYFLDLNPGGAFLFVEFYGGGPIVSHVAAAIAGEEDVSKFPCLADYNAWATEENRISGA